VTFISACDISINSTVTLKKSIGIITTGNVFSEFVASGKRLPLTFSYTFANAENNQAAVEITVAQRDPSGQEIITVAVIDGLPPKPKGKLDVVVTVTVDRDKQLRLKVTVPETGYIKELGPFPVS
jgi:molecular chaperone DnaK (HSP70)